MIRVGRYLQLAVGGLGTALAGLTALSALTHPARFLALPLLVSILFAITIVSGFTQWITFQRRHFDTAVRLFGFTIISWSVAAIVHAAYTIPDCSKGCTVVVFTAPK
ncbi:hypothetical protein [Sphingomonas echinoides]|uniref:Integron gene cassette protein n=1 Tax=Sphingomonas echinoides TaxID=59803 RepID=A0ABU4PQ81_9SPHN|nr:hypothetical protein [Sphingomonas echinoides]MDX5985312.1 hypothetical protein [Sphingomonas echinoides]